MKYQNDILQEEEKTQPGKNPVIWAILLQMSSYVRETEALIILWHTITWALIFSASFMMAGIVGFWIPFAISIAVGYWAAFRFSKVQQMITTYTSWRKKLREEKKIHDVIAVESPEEEIILFEGVIPLEELVDHLVFKRTLRWEDFRDKWSKNNELYKKITDALVLNEILYQAGVSNTHRVCPEMDDEDIETFFAGKRGVGDFPIKGGTGGFIIRSFQEKPQEDQVLAE